MNIVAKQTCSQCKVEKPLTDFGKNSQSRTGYMYVCSECRSNYSREWNKKRKANDQSIIEELREHDRKMQALIKGMMEEISNLRQEMALIRSCIIVPEESAESNIETVLDSQLDKDDWKLFE